MLIAYYAASGQLKRIREAKSTEINCGGGYANAIYSFYKLDQGLHHHHRRNQDQRHHLRHSSPL